MGTIYYVERSKRLDAKGCVEIHSPNPEKLFYVIVSYVYYILVTSSWFNTERDGAFLNRTSANGCHCWQEGLCPRYEIILQTWSVEVMVGDLLQRADAGSYFLSYASCCIQHFSKACHNNNGLVVHELSYPAGYLITKLNAPYSLTADI